MYFILPIREREKPRFDAYVEGILFDSKGEIVPNIFIAGLPIHDRASSMYKIKVDEHNSEIGMIRDRLVVNVHNSPIFIVSEKFKNLLHNNYINRAEFFPVEIDQVNKKPLLDYFICNLTKKIDCTDYYESELFFEDPDDQEGLSGIDAINSLVIDETKIPSDAHIFLLDNIRDPVVVVCQDLKQEIENQNISGFNLVIPEDFGI